MVHPTDARTRAFWQAFLAATPGADPARLTAVFAFDDNPEGAAFCAAAVLDGRKTATSSLDSGPLPRPGDLEIVTEHDGTPRAVIRITRVDRVAFGAVDEAFAVAEGDGSLAAWRETHLRYYGARCAERGEALGPGTMLRRIFFERVWPA